MSIPWVISNDIRPLYPVDVWWISPSSTPSIFARSRTHMYFNNYPGAWPAYTQAIDFLAAQNPTEIGLYGSASEYHYPIWVQIEDRLNTRPRVEYVGVRNPSWKSRGGSHAPPLIFSTRGSLSTLAGKAYRVVFENSLVTVLAMEVGGVNEIPEEWSRILTESEQFVIRPDLDVYLHRNENRLVYVKKRVPAGSGTFRAISPGTGRTSYLPARHPRQRG